MENKISRDGRYAAVITEGKIKIYAISNRNQECTLTDPIWILSGSINSYVWHHEESKLLATDVSGKITQVTLRRGNVSEENFPRNEFLKSLIQRNLDFSNIKHIRCVAFQRRFCIIKNSATQMVGLLWEPPTVPEIVWAADISASALFTSCDKGIVVFDPHLKSLYVYCVEDGRIREVVDADLHIITSDLSSGVLMKSSPDGDCVGILAAGNFFLGKDKFVKVPQENIWNFDLGEDKFSLLYKEDDGDGAIQQFYSLYSLSSTQQLVKLPIDIDTVPIFAVHFRRSGKILRDLTLQNLDTGPENRAAAKGNACLSLLDNALLSGQSRSITSILRIAENGTRKEVDEILQRLNDFFARDSQSHFAKQILGVAVSFGARVLKKASQHEFVAKFIFQWQNFIDVADAELEARLETEFPAKLCGTWSERSDTEVLKSGILSNAIPLAQRWLIEKHGNPGSYGKLESVRNLGLELIRQELSNNDPSSVSVCIDIIKNLGCDVTSTWRDLIGKESDPGIRGKMAEAMRMQGLWTEQLDEACSFVAAVDGVVLDHPEAGREVTQEIKVSSALELAQDEKNLIFAELFLVTQSEKLVTKVNAEDCWHVLLRNQITEDLLFWVRSQSRDDYTTALSLPYSWPINERMVEMAGQYKCETVLDLLAERGIFCRTERRDLIPFLRRLQKIGKLTHLGEVFTLPSANITRDLLDEMVIDYCDRFFKPRLFESYTELRQLTKDFGRQSLWMRILQEWKDFIKDQRNVEKFQFLIELNDRYLCEKHQDRVQYLSSRPWVTLFHYLNRNAEITEDIFERSIRNIPVLGPLTREGLIHPTLLELLDGEIPVRLKPLDHANFPHFSNKQLSQKYGQVEKLNFSFYLREGRPLGAYYNAIYYPKNKEKEKSLAYVASCIALEAPFDEKVTNSCVAFIEFLKQDSRPLRTTLRCLDVIAPSQTTPAELACLLSDINLAKRVKKQLEEVLVQGAAVMEQWQVAVDFSRIYGLEEPLGYLEKCAENNDWMNFLLFCQWFKYSSRIGSCAAGKFGIRPIGNHLERILQLNMESALKFLQGIPTEVPLGREEVTGNFFLMLWSATQNPYYSPEILLEKARQFQNAILPVIAAILSPRAMDSCLLTFLALNLPVSAGKLVPRELIQTALSGGNFKILKDSFQIFVPGHPLCDVTTWLDHCRRGQPSEALDSLLDPAKWDSLPSYPGFLSEVSTTGRLVIDIINGTLSHSIVDPGRRLALLDLLSRLPLGEVMDMPLIPDYGNLNALYRSALEADVELRIDQLLGDHSDFAYAVECQRIVRILLDGRHFERALKFAHLANLPADSVLVTQLAEEFNDASRDRSAGNAAFFKRCHSLLLSRQIDSELASGFFQDHMTKVDSVLEKYFVMRYAYWWKKHATPSHAELSELETLTWFYRVSAEIELQNLKVIDSLDFDIDNELSIDLEFTGDGSPYALTKSAALESAGVSNYVAEFPTIDEKFQNRVKALIDQNIDSENLIIALKLSAMFQVPSRSLELLLLSMEAAEDPASLSQSLDKLKNLTEVSVSIKDTRMLIDYIGDRLSHGIQLHQRISTYVNVAALLDLKYEYLVQHPLPVSILKMLLRANNPLGGVLTLGSNFTLAKTWISASGISQTEVLNLLCDELVEAARNSNSETSDQDNLMLLSLMHGQFNRLLTLCIDSSALGLRLMELALSQRDFGVAVELLIFAHCCFTSACDVENIGLVLNRSKSLIDTLAQRKEWPLIVRILTGIQRYSEMSYVFTLLKDNDQFEFLLRKGMDRLPLLRVALLDFVRQNSSENRELFRMVALHFHMYSEVAAMWEEEARIFLDSVVQMQRKTPKSKKSLNLNPAATTEMTETLRPTTPSLKNLAEVPAAVPTFKNAPESKRGLTLAMQNLAHAAEYYIQAGKLRHAENCAVQAELVALQIHLINSQPQQSSTSTGPICVLGLTPAEVNLVIGEVFSYREAALLARASSCSVNWGRALFRHYVVNNDERYFEDFCSHLQITEPLVDEIVACYQVDFTRGVRPDVLERLERIVSTHSDLEFQYRLASRLGLRSLVHRLISSPGVAYLKDTAWKNAAH